MVPRFAFIFLIIIRPMHTLSQKTCQ